VRIVRAFIPGFIRSHENDGARCRGDFSKRRQQALYQPRWAIVEVIEAYAID
jgi:hypothetical protein